MNEFVIITDSTCDLPKDYQEKYNIIVIPGHIVLPDKQDIPAFLAWESFSREEFYSELKSNPDGFTTSPPNISEYAKVFVQYVSTGYSILCLTISSGISGAFNFALAAKNQVLAQYHDAKIEIIDTLRFGPAIGLMAVYTSILRDNGKSMAEAVAYLENNKNCFHQAGWLDDLSFVAKKGRLTHAKAFLGTLAGIKPLGEFDYNGLTTVIGKANGTKKAYAALITYIQKTIKIPSEQIVFIAQTNRLEQAKEYKQMIEEIIRPKAVYIHDVFPSCGINIGPGLMAAYYYGNPISKDLSVERNIIELALYGGTEK